MERIFVLLILFVSSSEETFNSSQQYQDLDVTRPAPQPFFIIAHRVNSIRHAKYFLSLGSNALEADVTFSKENGRAERVWQGSLCDCCTDCDEEEDVIVYFEYIRKLTLRSSSLFNPKLAMLMLEIKHWEFENHRHLFSPAGKSLASTLLSHLMVDKDGNVNDFMIVIRFSTTDVKDFIESFIETIKATEPKALDYIYWDFHQWKALSDLETLWGTFNLKNFFQGDGNMLCEMVPNTDKIDKLAKHRDQIGYTKFHYVYYGTLDVSKGFHEVLDKNPNGILTNKPELLKYILKNYFFHKYFLANRDVVKDIRSLLYPIRDHF